MSLYPHYNCSLVIHKSCCSAAVLQVTVKVQHISIFTAHSSGCGANERWLALPGDQVTRGPAPGDVILINTGKLPPRWVGKWPPAEAAALWSAVHNPNLEIQSTIKPLKPSKPGHVDIYWPYINIHIIYRVSHITGPTLFLLFSRVLEHMQRNFS